MIAERNGRVHQIWEGIEGAHPLLGMRLLGEMGDALANTLLKASEFRPRPSWPCAFW
jgi:hypothetical protein